MDPKFAEWAERMQKRAEDPEFQANAAQWRETKNEAAQRENDRLLALHVAGVPASLWDAVLSPKVSDALQAVQRFIDAPRECLYLVLAGPAGRGKTFAAAWGVSRREGRYILAHDLVAAGTFDPVWKEIAAAPLLAIDELGSEYRNSAYEASLYSLLNARHAHGRKTILCTNLDGAGFVGRYCPKPGDPLRDRLRTAQAWVALPGESMRKPWNETDKEDET